MKTRGSNESELPRVSISRGKRTGSPNGRAGSHGETDVPAVEDEPGSIKQTPEEAPVHSGVKAVEETAPADAAGEDNDNAAEAEPGNGRKRKLMMVLLVLAAVIAVPVGIYLYFQSIHFETTDDAFIEAHVVQVSPRVPGHVQKVYVNDNQVVKAGDLLFELDAREYQAKVDAAEAQLKVAEANQRQAAIAVEITSVTAAAAENEGASAYESALAQIASNEALVQTAGKKVAEAQAMVDTSQAKARQGDSAVVAAKAEADRLTSDAQRTQALYENHNVSREDFEHAIAAARSAKASLQAAEDSELALAAGVNQAIASLHATSDTVLQDRAQLRASEADAAEAKAKMAAANVATEKIQGAQAELDTAIANVGVARANLDSAKLDLSYTKIRAEHDGKVTRKNVEPGAYLAAGQNVMALVQPDLWVVANFKENQLRYMNPGDKAEVEVDLYGNRKFEAHVESIQAGTGSRFSLLPPENATGNFVKVVQRMPVKLVFDEPLSELANLAPGLSVEPKVRVK